MKLICVNFKPKNPQREICPLMRKMNLSQFMTAKCKHEATPLFKIADENTLAK